MGSAAKMFLDDLDEEDYEIAIKVGRGETLSNNLSFLRLRARAKKSATIFYESKHEHRALLKTRLSFSLNVYGCLSG